MTASSDSSRYRQRKREFDRCLTVYGRKTVLEALTAPGVRCERLHLARSNQADPLLARLVDAAESRGAELHYHDRQGLSRISRNQRQDQGVAADISWDGYQWLDAFLQQPAEPARGPLLALDRIHNPQNLGMLIRAATAGQVSGILLPRRGCCEVDPLVIKASAGSLFRARLLRCTALEDGLAACREAGYEIGILEASASDSLFDYEARGPLVLVLGNESDGISESSRALADRALAIPLANGVESLNVAVTAALVAFCSKLR